MRTCLMWLRTWVGISMPPHLLLNNHHHRRRLHTLPIVLSLLLPPLRCSLTPTRHLHQPQCQQDFQDQRTLSHKLRARGRVLYSATDMDKGTGILHSIIITPLRMRRLLPPPPRQGSILMQLGSRSRGRKGSNNKHRRRRQGHPPPVTIRLDLHPRLCLHPFRRRR